MELLVLCKELRVFDDSQLKYSLFNFFVHYTEWPRTTRAVFGMIK